MATPEQCEVLQKIIYEHPRVVTALADGYDLWICPQNGSLNVWPTHNNLTTGSNIATDRLHWDVRLADAEMQPELFAELVGHLSYLDKADKDIVDPETITLKQAQRWSEEPDEDNIKLYEFLKTKYGK
jgi:hypothetical protein